MNNKCSSEYDREFNTILSPCKVNCAKSADIPHEIMQCKCLFDLSEFSLANL